MSPAIFAGNLSPVSLLVPGHKSCFTLQLVKSKSNTECFCNMSSITFMKDISYILVGFLTMLMNHTQNFKQENL